MVKVVLCGLGSIGADILKYLIQRSHVLVGAVDISPEKRGRTIAELTGLPSGVRVVESIRDVQLSDAEVAVFATKSTVTEMVDDVCYAVSSGLDVVTTSEEMAFPMYSDKSSAERIAALCSEKSATVVGIGVNPGFIMDLVPAVVASAVKSPTSVHVVRSVDAGKRRRQLQTKLGIGISRAKFDKGMAEGVLGHVGLVESTHIIALSLGKELVGLEHGVYPVMGSEDYVTGVRQFAEGKAGDCSIRLDLEMTVTSADFDVIEVKGEPDLKVRFEKGVFGDSATVAMVVHAVERIGNARPGLITVLDLPLTPH